MSIGENVGEGVGINTGISGSSAFLAPPADFAIDSVTSSTAIVSWTPPARGSAIGYKVYVNGVPTTVTGWTIGSSVEVSGLTPSTFYTMYIVTYNDGGESEPSNTETTITTAPATTTGIFVDKTLLVPIIDGSYSSDNRDNSGTQGDAYLSVQDAVDNMAASDDIWMRGNTFLSPEVYFENVLISGTTAPDGTPTNYCSLQSFPGEWAELDGQNNEQYTIGKTRSGRDPANDLAYWKFERLGITGGTDGGVGGGAGLYISGGPFICRYLNVHDNICTDPGGNPGGISGYTWRESVTEFCYFKNNGHLTSLDRNYAHITILGDYAPPPRQVVLGESTVFDPAITHHKNTWRYNNFADGSSVAFKVKGSQILTARNPAGNDYNDAYAEWGDDIHHNFFKELNSYTVILSQDFMQFHHNIIDTPLEGIAGDAHQPHFQKYKQAVYNNTILNPIQKGILHYGSDTVMTFGANPEHWFIDKNNIVAYQGADPNGLGSWCGGTAWNINTCSSNPTRPRYTGLDVSNAKISHNYAYANTNPNGTVKYDGPSGFFIYYTDAEDFEANGLTELPRTFYEKASSEGTDNLMLGTTGGDQYVTRRDHVVDTATGATIGNGGSGEVHPWRAGVTLPPYVGAVDPDNPEWVYGVLNDVGSAWMADQYGLTPIWAGA